MFSYTKLLTPFFAAAVLFVVTPLFAVSPLFVVTPAFADKQPVILGYLLDLSGKAAFLGQQSQAGAELAKRELEAEGYAVKIIYEDHRTEPKFSVAGAKKLLDIDGAKALMCDTTPACVAASPVAAAAKVPFMYQAPAVSILQDNPYAFKNFLDYEDGCKRIATYWRSIGVTRVANYKVNMEFGELCARSTRNIFPMQEELAFDTGNDLKPLVTRAKGEGVEAGFQTGYEADYISRLRASADLGYKAPLGMPEPLLTKAVIDAAKADVLEGAVTFGFQPIAPEFIAKLKAAGLYRGDSNLQSAAIAYLHVRQLAEAIAMCGEQGIECVTKRIEGASSDPILGFKGWKKRIASYPYALRRWTAGKLVSIGEK